MSKTYRHRLNDIVQAAAKITQYTHGIDRETFKADGMRVDGVLYNLMIVGEAVKNIPNEMRAAFPSVRWRDISRFRDRLVHHYFKIDLDIVWEIIEVHLPLLSEKVAEALAGLDSESSEESELTSPDE